ncbi:hypothetical protein I6A60_40200 [Frankia sp. AgB1.9]|uniref:hypothetical protein n=1 Tax=Frankia sp. AgB1.9 TaxID=1836968 RepID=UPI001A3AA3E2|nr:hypothetical protein [Frankia sp. AgB1.9]MBL7554007.1 hypothetical protein [Frankia sp. AgB1.9]MBL7624635.1 hypothetical protein [Frankia sp. AgB1.8]
MDRLAHYHPPLATRLVASLAAGDCVASVCESGRVDVWAHDDRLFEIVSFYCLPDDAWQYELRGLSGAPGAGPFLAVVIPDATPDAGSFTPMPAEDVLVEVSHGVTPWPILCRFLALIGSSGDIVNQDGRGTSARDQGLSERVSPHGSTCFKIDHPNPGVAGSRIYTLRVVTPGVDRSDYVEVEVPDAHPAGGGPARDGIEGATFTAHGSWRVPWPVFRRFVDAVQAHAA